MYKLTYLSKPLLLSTQCVVCLYQKQIHPICWKTYIFITLGTFFCPSTRFLAFCGSWRIWILANCHIFWPTVQHHWWTSNQGTLDPILQYSCLVFPQHPCIPMLRLTTECRMQLIPCSSADWDTTNTQPLSEIWLWDVTSKPHALVMSLHTAAVTRCAGAAGYMFSKDTVLSDAVKATADCV